MSNKIQGAAGIIMEVDPQKNANVKTPGYSDTGVAEGGGNNNAPAQFSEVDTGQKTAARAVQAILADVEGRLRVGPDVILDDETINYTAQNTGKHTYSNTTMTFAWTANGLQTNSGGVTTTTIGAQFNTYGMFPLLGNNGLICTSILSLSSTPVANSVIDFGMMLKGASNPFAPTDGAYFRINSTGIFGVVNFSGTETPIAPFSFTFNPNQKYRFVIRIYARKVFFFIDDICYGILNTPAANGTPFASEALTYGIRHAIVGGAAGGVLQALLSEYSVLIAGSSISKTLGEIGNGAFGSYQGLSGGTMGGLTVYNNSSNPVAAVPLNASLAANLPSGLGGQAWESFTSGLAVNTDGILMSYTVPAGTVSVPGKRLKIVGVKMSAFVAVVLAGGPLNSTFALTFGATAINLATAEAANTKKPRILLLPEFTQAITAAQAVNTMVSQPGGCVSMFQEPAYVNPGEVVTFTVKHIGTAVTSGTIGYNIQLVYSWE